MNATSKIEVAALLERIGTSRVAVFDIEADLIPSTKIYCIGITIIDKGEVQPTQVFTQYHMNEAGNLPQAVALINSCEFMAGHNSVNYDVPTIERILKRKLTAQSLDTMLLAKMMFTQDELYSIDFSITDFIPKYYGSFSLAAFGIRLGVYKESFDDFSQLTRQMIQYCKQDVHVTVTLLQFLLSSAKWPNDATLVLEHQVAKICQYQEQRGFWFDIEAARGFNAELRKEQFEIYRRLQKDFKPRFLKEGQPKKAANTFTRKEWLPDTGYKNQWCVVHPYSIPLATFKKGGFKFPPKTKTSWHQHPMRIVYKTTQGEYQPIKYTKFEATDNQIKIWLKAQYGVEFNSYTAKGNVKVDREVMENELGERGKDLRRFLKLKKDISQLSGTDNSLISSFNPNTHSIHGRIDTLGAATHRCTHCVPLTTLALTKTGWKAHNELLVGEEILGYNLATEQKEWTRVKAIATFKDAQVGRIGNKGNNLYCTADHKWVVVKRSRTNPLGMGSPRLVSATDISHHDGIVMNAPYLNPNSDTTYSLVEKKYDYDHLVDILQMTPSQLDAFLIGFLLADGYLKKSTNGTTHSWSFAQAEGGILEAAHTALYLSSTTRCSRSCKNKLKSDKHRYGYNVTQTNKPYIRAKTGNLGWTPTTIEDVWCPETELGTWVMKQPDGIITITGNSKPNMAQIPSGSFFRNIMTTPPGMKLVGADLANIEVRVLAHYLAEHGNTEYIKAVMSKDMHWYHAGLAGFIDQSIVYDEHNKEHTAARNASKKFFFGYLYGQGDTIRGFTLSVGLEFAWHNTTSNEKAEDTLDSAIPLSFTQKEYNTAQSRIEKRLNDAGLFPLKKDLFVQPTDRLILETLYGKQVADDFLKNLDGIKDLIKYVQKQSKDKGSVTAIDGRELFSRSPHSALNLLLQGSAGVVGKQWMVNYHKLAEEKGLSIGVDWYQSAYIHDEFQCPCKEELAPILEEALTEGAAMVTEQFNMNLPIKADAVSGQSWHDTH